MRLSKAFEGYWLDKELELSEQTVIRYSRLHDSLFDFLGDTEVEDITSQDIKRFIRYLRTETNLSKRTIFDAWYIMSAFWTWAEKELEITHVLRGKVDVPKYTKRKIEPLKVDEVKQLVRAIDYTKPWRTRRGNKTRSKRPSAVRDKAIILTMVDCGIRVGELCNLTIADYNRGRLHIQHGKGDKERFIPLGKRCQKAIWRYLATRPDAKPKEPLFCSREVTALDRANVRRIVKQAGDRAGIPGVHPHKLRHTFAILFLRAGGNPFELKELLGHETLEMVMNYVELAQTDLDDAQRRSSPADKWKL